MHPTDIFVGDLAGEFNLVPEAVDGPLIHGDFRMEKLEGDLLADFLVIRPIDDAHAPGAELLDHLKPPGEKLSLAKFFGSCFQRPGDRELRPGPQLGRALRAEHRPIRVLKLALGALDHHLPTAAFSIPAFGLLPKYHLNPVFLPNMK